MLRRTRDVVREIVKKVELPQYEVKRVLEAYYEAIFEFMSQGDDVLSGKLGKFTVRTMRACKRRNPLTGESFMQPKTRHAAFKFYNPLKTAVKTNRRGLDGEA